MGGGSNCPQSGIRYIPKRSAPHKPHPTTTRQPGAPKPTDPTQRKGNLRVYTTGNQQQRGCIISRGTWFTSGTCATFRTEDVPGMPSPRLSSHLTREATTIYTNKKSSGGVNIRSRRGPCTFEDDILTCGPQIRTPALFKVRITHLQNY